MENNEQYFYIMLEDQKIKQLRDTVDRHLYIIKKQNIFGKTAWNMLDEARELVKKLFPDKIDTFELIYTPRYKRQIFENINKIISNTKLFSDF